MVQRKVARHWRKLKRQPGAGSGPSDLSSATPLDEIAGDDSTPPDTASANDLLQRFLGQLDALDRQLVLLKLEGHSSAQSAAILKREPAFIRMRWSRLRQMLRKRGGFEE